MFHSSFHNQKIARQGKTYETFSDIIRHTSRKTRVRVVFFLVIVAVVLLFGSFIRHTFARIGSFFAAKIINIVSTVGGTPMQQDTAGGVNVLLIGYGGEGHLGGNYLADSIMVASFHPATNSVTMLSLPRDLYVYEKGKYANKINAIFDKAYRESQKIEKSRGGKVESGAFVSGNVAEDPHTTNIRFAVKELSRKVGDIVGMSIPYYMVIDFNGFTDVIELMGGVDIDVPETLHDTEYPDPTVGHYVTLHIDAGMQHMSGELALKYARSRHSTSDFARSQRQQQLLKSLVDKLVSTDTLTSPTKMKALYTQYTKMVVTNITVDEMIGMAKYALNRPDIFPFALSICQNTHYSVVTPGCVLQQKLYARAYLLPAGAEPENPFYDVTKFFAFLTAQNPGYLTEQAKIAVYNAIDPDVAKAYPYRQGLAGSVAARLKRYGFNLLDVDNAVINIPTTTVVVRDSTIVVETIKMLPLFLEVPFTIKTKADQLAGIVARGQTPAELGVIDPADFATGADMSQLPDIEIYLGNDALDVYGKAPFPMYKK